jgi:hypothetical protein
MFYRLHKTPKRRENTLALYEQHLVSIHDDRSLIAVTKYRNAIPPLSLVLLPLS